MVTSRSLDAAAIAKVHYDDAFNGRDFAKGYAIVAEDVTWLNVPAGISFEGHEGYAQFLQSWATAFPDSVVEVANIFSNGEQVAVEFTGRGTHTGPLMTPQGPIPPTGNTVNIPFCEILHVRGGKIVGARTYYDLATMMRQLGLIA